MGILSAPRTQKRRRVRLMDENELVLVRYIVGQLNGCYTVNGRPKMAKNMNQVMGDIFGVSKFVQRLERGCRDERTMVDLMQEINLEKIWALCRSREHYKMLATLVAIDGQIVSLQKKQRKMREGSSTAPSMAKYKKNEKELKRLLKVYKGCVKTFREVLDIRLTKRSGKYGGLLDFARDWKERYEYDIYDLDFGFGGSIFDGIEDSMANFIAKETGGKTKKGKSGRGAFGITDSIRESASIFDPLDDEFDDLRSHYEDDEEEDEEELDLNRLTVDDIVSGLADEFVRRGIVAQVGVPGEKTVVTRPKSAKRKKGDGDDLSDIRSAIKLMAKNIGTLNHTVSALMSMEEEDLLEEEEDEEEEGYEDIPIVARRPSRPRIIRPKAEDGEEGIPMEDIETIASGGTVEGVVIEDASENP